MRAREWDESYILGLPVQEYDDIEFKASPSVDLSSPDGKNKTMDTLAKGISALANSGGGFLVLGVNDPKACKGGVLEIVNGGVLKEFGKVDTAEWLRQIIPNMTEHKLRDFEVHAIEAMQPSSQIDPDKAVFVIGVPDSSDAPHQNARDHKYYVRIGGNSQPAPHRIVMDIVGRRQHPKIELTFSLTIQFETKKRWPQNRDTRSQETAVVCNLVLLGTNTGKVLAQYVNAEIEVPVDMLAPKDAERSRKASREDQEYRVFRFQNTRRDVVDVQVSIGEPIKKHGPSWFDPILPGRSHEWQLPLRSDWADFYGKSYFSQNLMWTTYADNGTPHHGIIATSDIRIDDMRVEA